MDSRSSNCSDGMEKTQRLQLEELAQAGTDETKKKIEAVYKPLLNNAFVPVVALYANQTRLKKDRLKVINVTLPDFNDKENVFIGIEAEYELQLNVPFFRKKIFIRKKAFERAWVGGS